MFFKFRCTPKYTDENRRFLRLETMKTYAFYVLNRQKPIKTTKTKRRGFNQFWRSKTDKNLRFLLFESGETLNTEFIKEKIIIFLIYSVSQTLGLRLGLFGLTKSLTWVFSVGPMIWVCSV